MGVAMITGLKRLLGRFRGSTLTRSDRAQEAKQLVENTDALAASGARDTDPSGSGGYSAPPNYVPRADEGRPRR